MKFMREGSEDFEGSFVSEGGEGCEVVRTVIVVKVCVFGGGGGWGWVGWGTDGSARSVVTAS
jgi:hypothetical protein